MNDRYAVELNYGCGFVVDRDIDGFYWSAIRESTKDDKWVVYSVYGRNTDNEENWFMDDDQLQELLDTAGRLNSLRMQAFLPF